MDRQEFRLVFERSDATLYDWVAARVRVRVLLGERRPRGQCAICPGVRLDAIAADGGRDGG